MNSADPLRDTDQQTAETRADGSEPIEPVSGLADLQVALAEMEDRWRRTLADLDNLRKRVARDREGIQQDERARVAREWLPVIDNLDLALAHANQEPDPVIDGVRAVRDQALAVMAKLGFPRRDDRGRPFDPQKHEAVSTALAPDPELEGTVLKVLRPGYGTEEKVLRPASVVVGTKAS
jgi:molecular chaperone GrpE